MFKVAPAYLEDIIVKHVGVADVAVVGVPDEEAGELPKAYVVRQPGSSITTEEISNHVAGKLITFSPCFGQMWQKKPSYLVIGHFQTLRC